MTGHGMSMLRRHLSEPLPLSELIFLYKAGDIRPWLLANPCKDPLDLLVFETGQATDECRAATRAPVSGGPQSFNHNVWHRIGSAENVNYDIDTEGNGPDNSNDYKDSNFDDTTIVDHKVVSALSLAPNARSGEDHHEV